MNQIKFTTTSQKPHELGANVTGMNMTKNRLNFLTELQEIFIDSVSEAKEKGILSTSQRQAIIKLIEKKDRNKRFIQNWRPISLLNVGLKIISKALSQKLKNVLPDLISSQQTAFLKKKIRSLRQK